MRGTFFLGTVAVSHSG